MTGRTASKPTLRSGSCANQSPTWSHSEATNSCILPEFKSFCQIFSPTSTFDLGNLSATDETLSSQIGRRLQVTPTLEQKSVVQVTRCNKKASANDGVYISIPITSYFSTVKWKAGMALDRPVEKRINCYLRNSSRGKQMHVGWVNDDLNPRYPQENPIENASNSFACLGFHVRGRTSWSIGDHVRSPFVSTQTLDLWAEATDFGGLGVATMNKSVKL